MPPSVEALNAALPQYEFVELIGAGGMGAVYKARQPRLNRHVAIKILPPIADDSLGFAERFAREAQSMARLSHPHIVAVYDFGETPDGQLYFVMEYVEGADLHRLISSGQLTLDHFYGWIPQVCDAIQYAHDHGIVHRDIKPANILIDREGRVKIADFGLAKLTNAENPGASLTQSDLSMGTPDYAAPEQIEGGNEVDWRSDIYSLGVVMYQMLTGRLPRGAFPLPSERLPGLDARLDEVVLRAMQSEPALRFQRASEIAHRITEIWSGPPAEPASRPAPKRVTTPPKSPLLLVAGIVGLSVLAGVVLFILRNQSDAPTPRERLKAGLTAAATVTSSPPEATSGSPTPTEPRKASPAAGEPPPRDFTRRQAQTDEDPRPANLSAFRDKLGPRKPIGGMLDQLRRQRANLTALSKEGDPLDEQPLANLPKDLKPVVQLAIGQGPPKWKGPEPFAVALQANGEVRAWGDPAEGRLTVPEAAQSDVIQVAAGPVHALALRRDGQVVAWGDNTDGQTTLPAGLSGVTAIAAGGSFSLALKADGTVVAWGSGPAAVVPAGLADVVQIDAGFAHAVARQKDGTVALWGSNEYGQLDAPSLSGVVEVTASFANTFARLADGSLAGWGASGEEFTPPGAAFLSIDATGEALVARDSEGRLVIHGPKHRGNLPAMLRQLPREVRIEVSERVFFAYRPAELRQSDTPAPATVEEPTPPAPPAELSEAGRQIEELQQKFEQAYLDQVSLPHEASLRQLNAFYLNHLDERMAAASAASLLEEAVAWRDEAERIRAGQPLPESDDPSLPAALIELRKTYRETAARHEATRHEAEAGLLKKYDEALQAMQDRFTQEQKLDEALEVKAHRDQRQPVP
ncbi:MAG: protein kinase [Verrucomicrobiales bacterium]|nr:protein kinase [Verrucomicrobiales bacterium]